MNGQADLVHNSEVKVAGRFLVSEKTTSSRIKIAWLKFKGENTDYSKERKYGAIYVDKKAYESISKQPQHHLTKRDVKKKSCVGI